MFFSSYTFLLVLPIWFPFMEPCFLVCVFSLCARDCIWRSVWSLRRIVSLFGKVFIFSFLWVQLVKILLISIQNLRSLDAALQIPIETKLLVSPPHSSWVLEWRDRLPVVAESLWSSFARISQNKSLFFSYTFFFCLTVWFVGSQFLDQGLNARPW